MAANLGVKSTNMTSHSYARLAEKGATHPQVQDATTAPASYAPAACLLANLIQRGHAMPSHSNAASYN